MKAKIIKKYGPPDIFEDADVPIQQVGENEILIKNIATTVNPIDWKIRSGSLKFIYPIKFPKILGSDVSGEVIEIGKNVKQFSVGDKVFGMLSTKGGTYSEYSIAYQNEICIKPEKMDHYQAATVPCVGLTSLQALRDIGKIKKGNEVLINGASGGVGIFGVQIAKAFEAKVTAVCSEKNFDFVKSFGAEELIDYTKTDFTRLNKKFDIVFDCIANRSFSDCKRILNSNGIYISTLPSIGIMISRIFSMFGNKKGYFVMAKADSKNLNFLKELIDNNSLKTYIDKTFTLSEIAEAHKYSETGRVKGKISIRIQ